MSSIKKKLGLVYDILSWIVTGFLICVLVVVVLQKFSNNKISIAGIQLYAVASNSMYPKYKVGDVLIAHEKDDYNIGDAVTYQGLVGQVEGRIITHERVKKYEDKGTTYFVTKGINNEIEDPEISIGQVYGKIVYKSKIFSALNHVMSNIIAFYVIVMFAGVTFSYQLISGFFIKD